MTSYLEDVKSVSATAARVHADVFDSFVGVVTRKKIRKWHTFYFIFNLFFL